MRSFGILVRCLDRDVSPRVVKSASPAHDAIARAIAPQQEGAAECSERSDVGLLFDAGSAWLHAAEG